MISEQFDLSNRLGRGDRTALGIWFWELDRVLLALILSLLAIGLLAVAAASPATARRLSSADVSLPELYFFYRQFAWAVIAFVTMLVISMFPKNMVRRMALIGFAAMVVAMLFTIILGSEINGAKRWINLGFMSFQASEFLKPFYAVAIAWVVSWKLKDKSLPVYPIIFAITGFLAMILMLQPDLGQTILLSGICFAVIMVSGVKFWKLAALFGMGIGGLVTAYFTYSVAATRIDAFLFGTDGITHDKLALSTLSAGGLFGVGPGLGERKYSLPEAHTDYIFSVIGEEFGLLACAAIIIIYFAIIIRVALRLFEEKDYFTILAVTGLVTQFCGQAMINIAVNLGMFPSKGMTLPFISYGGSSLWSISITSGLILALTRRNPFMHKQGQNRRYNR
ncbi:cell division protein FtsW [Sphingorhabdus lutea]|uniref:Probable peptidoglycan glycosyltransferase FtsW n=2 Tax=Sphingorhabdus lutea TaxID=1913578 RepID=A0A1L3JF46_9SPHN|nr:cell division protein FtsW [Sphingorhabdus lutea]